MSWLRPSTTAVLPTPGSPISTGLFLVRRLSTCITRSISFSRPITGSSLPSRASWVRLRPNWSSTIEPALLTLADAAAGRGLALAAGVARQQLDHGLTHAVEVGAELLQHLRGDALALADQPEQDVLGADVVVAELQRLAQRELEHLLGAGRERDVSGRGGLALSDDLLDLLADGLERDVHRLEGLRGDALALVDQPEQDVLGADVVVVEHPRFFLREDDDPSRSVGEPFEHVSVLRATTRMFHPSLGDQRTPSYPRGASGAAPDDRSQRPLTRSIPVALRNPERHGTGSSSSSSSTLLFGRSRPEDEVPFGGGGESPVRTMRMSSFRPVVWGATAGARMNEAST